MRQPQHALWAATPNLPASISAFIERHGTWKIPDRFYIARGSFRVAVK